MVRVHPDRPELRKAIRKGGEEERRALHVTYKTRYVGARLGVHPDRPDTI